MPISVIQRTRAIGVLLFVKLLKPDQSSKGVIVVIIDPACDAEFRTSDFNFQPANNASIVEPSLRAKRRSNPFFLCAARWIASRSLSSGAHSRDPLARNDVELQTRIRNPRRDAPEALHEAFAQRGRGERRMPVAPAASCALVVVERTRVTTSTPESPGVPARNGFNGFLRALPGDRALLPPSSADKSCLSPVGPT